jgi:hypothetical protein
LQMLPQVANNLTHNHFSNANSTGIKIGCKVSPRIIDI